MLATSFGDGGAAPARAQEQILASGSRVEARIGPEERHRYRIAAGASPADGWLRVAVEERGADVVLDLLAPDGSVLVTADSPNCRFGLESVLFQRGDGGQEIEVRVSPQVQTTGAYAIVAETVADEAPGTPQRSAERLAAEASRHYALDTREGREAALSAYRQSLPLWRTLGRALEEWDALYSMAVLLRLSGEFQPELEEVLTRALGVQQALADPRQEARILNEMGYARYSLGQMEEARELYRRSREVWESAPDPYGQALTLNNLGLTYYARGDLRTTLGYYEQALSLLRQAGDPRTEAILVNNLGTLLRDLGEPKEARSRFAEALDQQRRLGDRREEANVLANLAQVARETGHYDEALELYRQALEIARREGDTRGEGRLLSSLGMLHRFLGDPARAVDHLEASLELRRQTGDRAGEAITLHNLGLAVQDLRDGARAADLFHQALAIQRALGDRRAEAITLYNLGTLETAAGRVEEGEKLIDGSLAILGALDDRRERCEALRRAGEARAMAGRAEQARPLLTESLEICRAVADTPRELRALVALARVERTLGRQTEATGLTDEALARIESTRAALVSPEMRASYLSRELGAYELGIELRMEAQRREPAAGHDREALALAERARARSFLDLLEESGAEVRQGVDPELSARRRELEQRLEAKARRRLTLGSQERDAVRRRALDGELRALVDDLEAVDAEIRRRSPRYAELVQPRPLEAAAIQELLDPGTLLLVYSLGEERSFLWAVSRSSLSSFELPSRAVLEAAARQVYDAWRVLDVHDRREGDAAGERLSRLILEPAASLLADRRLVVVADGALQYVPFGGLPRPTAPGETAAVPEPLLVRHEIVNLPSASALAVQRQLLAGRPPAPRTVAVLADPVFRADDPRLRPILLPTGGPAPPAPARTRVLERAGGLGRLAWSRAEAEAIARLAGSQRSLVATGLDASLDTLKDVRLRGYGVLHLATHGIMDAEEPALSGLVLSLVDRAGHERPGFLSLPEIYGLDLSADLVVLSGCETALGKEVRGEGLVGLSRGFLYAGAARVMASLWRVQDHATAELMRRFYEALLGDGSLRPAAALRQAQLSMLRDRRWSDPYHWAGFALYGDWR